jgi:hypothetical protein
MGATQPISAPSSPAAPTGGTVTGAAAVRRALGRLRAIAALALAISALVVIESYLASIGVFGKIPKPGAPFNVSWITGLQIGLGIATGIVIGILVLLCVVFGLIGFLAWRRGVLKMVASAPEIGPAQVNACRQARRDLRATLWLFVVFVLVAILVSVAFAGLNGTLFVLGLVTLPGALGTIATEFATGVVLIGIYYFGTRHLVGLLNTIASPTERSLLERGRSLMIAGAVLGLGAAFSAAFWAFSVFAVLSIALILPGVGYLVQAYDLWLSEHRFAPIPARTAGAMAA